MERKNAKTVERQVMEIYVCHDFLANDSILAVGTEASYSPQQSVGRRRHNSGIVPLLPTTTHSTASKTE